MNKAQIKAELRRSACEDKDPWSACSWDAFCFAADAALETHHAMGRFRLSTDDQRTFFLLVAEAL